MLTSTVKAITLGLAAGHKYNLGISWIRILAKLAFRTGDQPRRSTGIDLFTNDSELPQTIREVFEARAQLWQSRNRKFNIQPDPTG